MQMDSRGLFFINFAEHRLLNFKSGLSESNQIAGIRYLPCTKLIQPIGRELRHARRRFNGRLPGFDSSFDEFSLSDSVLIVVPCAHARLWILPAGGSRDPQARYGFEASHLYRVNLTIDTKYNGLQRIEDRLAGRFTGNAGRNHRWEMQVARLRTYTVQAFERLGIMSEAYTRCHGHLFSFMVQFRTTVMGGVPACFTCVLIRNRCPSRLTS